MIRIPVINPGTQKNQGNLKFFYEAKGMTQHAPLAIAKESRSFGELQAG